MQPNAGRCLVLLLTLLRAPTLVSSEGCTLEQFMQSDQYDTNFDISNLVESYPDQKSVKVSCVLGYSGFFKMTCNVNQWRFIGRKCEPRSCGHPGDAQFADFRLTGGKDFVFGSQVEYTCHKGYNMVSRRNNRRCMAQGWDGNIPVCEPIRCPVIYADDNVLVQGDTDNAKYRHLLRFSCRSNHQMLSGPQEIYCDERGEWTGTVPKCIEIRCARPNVPNGRVLGGAEEYRENEYLQYECDNKYQRLENRLPKCANLGNTADWSPAPVCEPIKCRLQADRDARYEPSDKNVFLPGESLSVHCRPNFWVGSEQNTSAVAVCRENGTWTVYTTCREYFCTNVRPKNVSWWQVYRGDQISVGYRVRYHCASGYERTGGTDEARCTRNGWSPDPLCREKTCAPNVIDNAVLESVARKYRIGERASYVCMDGYSGSPIRTCRENGWDGSSKCAVKKCARVQIPGAQLKTSSTRQSYDNGTKLQYVCSNNDYAFTVRCNMGKWDGIQECSGCGKAHLDNGFVVKTSPSTIHYRCNEGYKLSTHIGWGSATCKDGHWTGFSGQCIENSTCGIPPMIPNGKALGGQHVNQENSSVPVICEEGFLAQVQNLTCKNGDWSLFGNPLEDICQHDHRNCGTPPKINNAVVITSQKLFPPNSTVVYQCRHKFHPEGNNRTVCVNGQWDAIDFSCTQKTCDPIEIDNAVLDSGFRKYWIGERASYVCMDGYSGSPIRTCRENGWEGSSKCAVRQYGQY